MEIPTSSPVCATIWAARKDGKPRKVMIGLEFVRKAFSRRNWGFLIDVVIAEVYDILSLKRFAGRSK